ncbi:hypothetical protein Fot_42673 [Forsythia ovata]|uniref:Uncharacterized protein n=1 Tax=Forsythia ovata TaxID=205694 RepID=A0ABD1RLV2_9LAMI
MANPKDATNELLDRDPVGIDDDANPKVLVPIGEGDKDLDGLEFSNDEVVIMQWITKIGRYTEMIIHIERIIPPSINGADYSLEYEGTENQGSDDQVGSDKCPNCTSDQWNVPNIVEKVGPRNLSRRFSNGTSTMDIDDKYFDDPDSDDEAGNHFSGVEMSYLSSRYFGQAKSLQLKVGKSF